VKKKTDTLMSESLILEA